MTNGKNVNALTRSTTLLDGSDGKELLRVEFQPDRPENVVIEYGYVAPCPDPSTCPLGGEKHGRLRRLRIPLARLAEAIVAAQALSIAAPSVETLQ